MKFLRGETVDKLKAIHAIVKREHPITLRSVFYRMVSDSWYDSMKQTYYQTCAKLVKTGTIQLTHPKEKE
jgi:hypothetical protein